MTPRDDLSKLLTKYLDNKAKVINANLVKASAIHLDDKDIEDKKKDADENSIENTTELNKNIISSLKSGAELPASISQDMLFKWLAFNINTLDSKTSSIEQDAFFSVFSNNHFLDRLILGKGSEDYQKNSKKYSQNGKIFIEGLLLRGTLPKTLVKDEHALVPLFDNGINRIKSEIERYIIASQNLDDTQKASVQNIRLSASQLFSDYFKKIDEIDNSKDQSSVASLEQDAQKLNNEILLLLKSPISPDISQDMLIQWFTVNLYNFDKPTITPAQEALLTVFNNTDFLDRLLLGKGSVDYLRKSESYANQGLKFIESLITSGPPIKKETKNDNVDDEKIVKIKRRFNFPETPYHFGNVRLLIDQYLINTHPTEDHEKKNINLIHLKAKESAKQKWRQVIDYISAETYQDPYPNIQLNINRLIYHDLQKKALNIEQMKRNELEILLSTLPESYDDFIKQNQTGNAYPELTDLINKRASDFLSIEYDIDIDSTLTLQLDNDEAFVVASGATRNQKYLNLMNTSTYLFRQSTPLPNFVSREDLLQLLFYDPLRMTAMEFNKNEDLLERLGDLNEVILLLNKKAARLKQIGMNADFIKDSPVIPLLEEVLKKKQEKLNEYKAQADTTAQFLKGLEEKIRLAEIKKHNEAQLADFSEVLKNIDILPLTKAEHTAFTNYIKEIVQNDAKNYTVNLRELMQELDNSIKELDNHFKSLKETELFIKDKQSKSNEPDSNLEITLDDIYQKLSDMEHAKERILLLKENYKIISDQPVEEKSKENQLPKKSKAASNQEMILYLIIMTRKSLLEGNPSRDYINQLYSDKKLNAYIHLVSSKKLKNKLNTIENELVNEMARQLKDTAKLAIANTDRDYFTIDPHTGKPKKEIMHDNLNPCETYRLNSIKKIKSEIDACKDIRSRQKINSHWIKVMKKAYENQDQFTFNIISAALQSQDTQHFFGQSVYFKSSQFKLHNLLALGKDGRDFFDMTKTSMMNNNYDFVPDPSVFAAHAALYKTNPSSKTKESLNSFLHYHDHLQKEQLIAIPIRKQDKHRLISNWINDQPDSEKMQPASLSELSSYIMDTITASIATDKIAAQNKDLIQILNEIPKCKTHKELVSCLDRLPIPIQLSIKEFDFLHKGILKHLHLQKKELSHFANSELNNLLTSKADQQHLPVQFMQKIVEHLKLVKDGFDINQRQNKLSNAQIKQLTKINKLIDAAMIKLEKNPNPNLDEMNTILKKLATELQKAIAPSNILPKSLYVFKRRSSDDFAKIDQLAFIREDINYLNAVNQIIMQINHQSKINALHTKDTTTPADEHEELRDSDLSEGSHASSFLDDKVSFDATIQDPISPTTVAITASLPLPAIAASFTDASEPDVVDTLTLLNNAHFDETFSLDDWIYLKPFISMPSYDPDVPEPSLPESTLFLSTPREYEHKSTHTHIQESIEHDRLTVNVTQEPDGYKTMAPLDKEKIDFLIATSMVQLLVNRCGNSEQSPVHIIETDNADRLRALILICKANDLVVKLPDNHPYLHKPDKLSEDISKMKINMPSQFRITFSGTTNTAPTKDTTPDQNAYTTRFQR